jgi:hypothetical protein
MPLPNCAEAVPTQRIRTKTTAGIFFFIGLLPFLPSEI